MDGQITDCQDSVTAAIATTLAPLPLNTGKARAAGPKCSRKRSRAAAVQRSAP